MTHLILFRTASLAWLNFIKILKQKSKRTSTCQWTKTNNKNELKINNTTLRNFGNNFGNFRNMTLRMILLLQLMPQPLNPIPQVSAQWQAKESQSKVEQDQIRRNGCDAGPNGSVCAYTNSSQENVIVAVLIGIGTVVVFMAVIVLVIFWYFGKRKRERERRELGEGEGQSGQGFSGQTDENGRKVGQVVTFSGDASIGVSSNVASGQV